MKKLVIIATLLSLVIVIFVGVKYLLPIDSIKILPDNTQNSEDNDKPPFDFRIILDKDLIIF